MKRNYINTLQEEVVNLEKRNVELVTRIKALQEYVSSAKFSCGSSLDGYVNVRDIQTRINEILSE